MTASREQQHAERVAQTERPDLKLLPIAAIYGANGSGKSNFYHAVDFLRSLVLRPLQAPEDRIPVKPFRLDDVSETKASEFVVEILTTGDVIYRLSFAVTSREVLEEKLEIIGVTTDRLIYSRQRIKGREQWNLDYFQRSRVAAKVSDFMSFKSKDTLPNQLFLSVLRGKDIAEADAVLAWFRDGLQLMTANSFFKQLEISLKAVDGVHGLREFCIQALSKADTGIVGLEREEVSVDSIPWPPKEAGNIKEFLRQMVGEGNAILMRAPDGQRITLRHEKDGLRAFRLKTVHHNSQGKKVEFYLADESDGTQRFVDLLPVFFELARSKRPRVFIIDEIDRSLHTELTRNLLNAFLHGLSQQSRSQVVFTTHDVMLVDQDLFRRDELWFTQKEVDGHSLLYPLSDFKGVRADKDILKSYLLGRFGGIPKISGFHWRGQSWPTAGQSSSPFFRG